MSSSSKTMSEPYLDNLRHVLRCANQRYSQIAAAVRESTRPTYHARKRAQRLRLRISVEKADLLDQRYISLIPLPVLDIPGSPPRAPAQRRPQMITIPPMRVVAPIPVRPRVTEAQAPAVCPQHAQIEMGSPMALSTKVVGREREIKRLSRQSSVASQDLDTLKFDVTVTIEGPMVDAHGRMYWANDAEDSSSASEDGRVQRPVRAHGVSSKAGWRKALRLDVPFDVNNRMSWGSNSSSSELVSSFYSSSSSSSSSGLTTPETEEPKLMIRIKRKSSTSFMDMDDEDVSSEKRTKYDSKECARPSSRRSNSRPFSSSSRASSSSRPQIIHQRF